MLEAKIRSRTHLVTVNPEATSTACHLHLHNGFTIVAESRNEGATLADLPKQRQRAEDRAIAKLRVLEVYLRYESRYLQRLRRDVAARPVPETGTLDSPNRVIPTEEGPFVISHRDESAPDNPVTYLEFRQPEHSWETGDYFWTPEIALAMHCETRYEACFFVENNLGEADRACALVTRLADLTPTLGSDPLEIIEPAPDLDPSCKGFVLLGTPYSHKRDPRYLKALFSGAGDTPVWTRDFAKACIFKTLASAKYQADNLRPRNKGKSVSVISYRDVLHSAAKTTNQEPESV
jgi:hypothetical protein